MYCQFKLLIDKDVSDFLTRNEMRSSLTTEAQRYRERKPLFEMPPVSLSKLLIGKDVTGVADVLPNVLPIKLLIDNNVTDVADFPTRKLIG